MSLELRHLSFVRRIEPWHGVVFLQSSAHLLICSAAHTENRQAPRDLVIVSFVLAGVEVIFVLLCSILLVKLLDASGKVVLDSFFGILIASSNANSANLGLDRFDLGLCLANLRP